MTRQSRRLPAVINRLENGHETETADCALIALGNYLDIPYTDVIRAAARVVEDGGRSGLTLPVIKRIAKLFNAPLRVLNTFDPEEAYGIALVPGHAAVLRNGMVMDRLLVFEWADWLQAQKCSPKKCRLLVVQPESAG